MKIETKYDIGDKVWRIKQKRCDDACPTCNSTIAFKTKWVLFRRGPVKIRSINVQAGRKKTCTHYTVGRYDFDNDWFGESELFITKAEARAECDKRNEVSNVI